MSAELVQDKNDPNVYRVEFCNSGGDGGCEVAIFSGPDALARAITFASAYYDKWGDPTDICQGGRVPPGFWEWTTRHAPQ